MNKLADYLKSKLTKMPYFHLGCSPVWKGPLVDGITQSLLNDYLFCKERFRIHTVDGLTYDEGFAARIEYGNMWHLLEECHASQNRNGKEELIAYVKELGRRYPTQGSEIVKWYNVAMVQFPIYCDYWRRNPDVKSRSPLFQEEKFEVIYDLPSGRKIKMRGKFDSVDVIGKGIYLQENKTKSEIDEEKLKKQLTFDLQTMFYIVALKEYQSCGYFSMPSLPILGIRYNVIRRPLSGGSGSIRPHKAKGNKPAESDSEFYERLKGIIEENRDTFFVRWKVEVPESFVHQFKTQFLNPLLENLLDDYEWWKYCKEYSVNPFDYLERKSVFSYHYSRHYRLPYGIYNVIAEGGNSDLDEYLLNGNRAGLKITDNLFPEL